MKNKSLNLILLISCFVFSTLLFFTPYIKFIYTDGHKMSFSLFNEFQYYIDKGYWYVALIFLNVFYLPFILLLNMLQIRIRLVYIFSALISLLVMWFMLRIYGTSLRYDSKQMQVEKSVVFYIGFYILPFAGIISGFILGLKTKK